MTRTKSRRTDTMSVERNLGSEQVLTWRPLEEDPAAALRADLGELARVLEEVHDLHELELRLVAARDVLEGHLGAATRWADRPRRGRGTQSKYTTKYIERYIDLRP